MCCFTGLPVFITKTIVKCLRFPLLHAIHRGPWCEIRHQFCEVHKFGETNSAKTKEAAVTVILIPMQLFSSRKASFPELAGRKDPRSCERVPTIFSPQIKNWFDTLIFQKNLYDRWRHNPEFSAFRSYYLRLNKFRSTSIQFWLANTHYIDLELYFIFQNLIRSVKPATIVTG